MRLRLVTNEELLFGTLVVVAAVRVLRVASLLSWAQLARFAMGDELRRISCRLAPGSFSAERVRRNRE